MKERKEGSRKEGNEEGREEGRDEGTEERRKTFKDELHHTLPKNGTNWGLSNVDAKQGWRATGA